MSSTSRTTSWPRSVALEVALENRAIGRRIAQLRENAHLTQPAAAERAGVSLRGYQKWESGASRPNWTNLEKLAEVFGVKEDEIIGSLEPDEDQLDRIEAKLDELLAISRETEQAPRPAKRLPAPPSRLVGEDDEPTPRNPGRPKTQARGSQRRKA
jgi:transcriptional regulator with XRE-family HTH domain